MVVLILTAIGTLILLLELTDLLEVKDENCQSELKYVQLIYYLDY